MTYNYVQLISFIGSEMQDANTRVIFKKLEIRIKDINKVHNLITTCQGHLNNDAIIFSKPGQK